MHCSETRRDRSAAPGFTILARFTPPAIEPLPEIRGGLSDMSNPLSGIPDPETRRPVSRRFQPSPVREALGEMKDALHTRLRRLQPMFQRLKYRAKDAGRRTQRYVQDLWFRGKRNPRKFALPAGAAALALISAYAVSASMTSDSLCPSATQGKAPKFMLVMDSIPSASAGSRLDIQYEVCGLPSGTPYRGKIRLVQQQKTIAKKKSAAAKPLVMTFKDRSKGLASRGEQPVSLASTRPGAYTLQLIVADDKGRERKRSQKIIVRR